MSRKRTIGLLAVAGATVLALTINQIGDASAAASLKTNVAPGGNFDLSIWQLQLPTGSPGSPDTKSPSQLKGANGFTNGSFFTDKTDGSMTFWAPEKGVTTANSNFARSELREMTSSGKAADWKLAGTNKLSATIRATLVTKSVCVGQVHIGSGSPTSTKPLMELYYHANGDIVVGLEKSPKGQQTSHTLGNVPIGTKWSYVITITSTQTKVTINGKTTSYTTPTSFKPYGEYFKAGSYNQSSSNSTTKGAKVKFYALSVSH
jgi:hypothetical protein